MQICTRTNFSSQIIRRCQRRKIVISLEERFPGYEVEPKTFDEIVCHDYDYDKSKRVSSHNMCSMHGYSCLVRIRHFHQVAIKLIENVPLEPQSDHLRRQKAETKPFKSKNLLGAIFGGQCLGWLRLHVELE